MSGNRNFFIRQILAGRCFVAIVGRNMLRLTLCGIASFGCLAMALVFGGVTGLAFFLWGGFSVVHQREKVGYAWDEAPQVYKGIVETVPEIRGKTWRAEVHVEGRHITKGTWQKVDRSVLLSWIPDTVAEPLSCGDTLCFMRKFRALFRKRN